MPSAAYAKKWCLSDLITAIYMFLFTIIIYWLSLQCMCQSVWERSYNLFRLAPLNRSSCLYSFKCIFIRFASMGLDTLDTLIRRYEQTLLTEMFNTNFYLSKKLVLDQIYKSLTMRKCVLCHMRTTKAQIRLHIRAVWSAPLLFTA